jgi:hypothetical protein
LALAFLVFNLIAFNGIAAGTNAPSAPQLPLFRPVTNEYNLLIDFAQPTNYSGIPTNVTWFKRSDNQNWCVLQGRVTTKIALPDSQSITETFYIVYIDRDEEGVYKVRAESVEKLPVTNAINRLDAELGRWSSTEWSPAQRNERKSTIVNWLRSNSPNREPYEGFRSQRAGYEISFSFGSMKPAPAAPRYIYEVQSHEPKPDAKSQCFVHLRLIERKKASWAKAHPNSTTPPSLNDLGTTAPWLLKFRCPIGGTYSVGKLDEPPTCTIPGHKLSN